MRSYSGQKRRMLFVLKEAIAPNGSWPDGDLREAPDWNYHDTSYQRETWRTLVRWAAVVLDGDRLGKITEDHWQTLLPRIAVVNLSKVSGASVADPRKISAVLADPEYVTLLRRQLGLYGPHITVCGGKHVFDWLASVMAWEPEGYGRIRCRTTGDHICFTRSEHLGLVIDFWHPAQYRRTQPDLVRILGEVVKRLAGN